MTNSNPRRGLSKRLRYEVIRRDGYTCRYCGASAPDAKLTVDHVIPRALGGTDDPKNLVTACVDCNDGKASTAPDQRVVDDVDDLAFMYAAAIRRVTEMRTRDRERIADAVSEFKAAWDSWTVTGTDKRVPLDDFWALSVERWVALDITTDDLLHFVPIAMKSKATLENKWRYYCGCIWAEVDTRRTMALEIMKQGKIADFPDEPAEDDKPIVDDGDPAPFDNLEQDDMQLDDIDQAVDRDPPPAEAPPEPFESWLDRVFIATAFDRACGICKLPNPTINCGREDCFLPIGGRVGP